MEAEHATTDKARRVAQHGVIEANVVRDVNSGITARAEQAGRDGAHVMNEVAGRLRGKAVATEAGEDHT